MEAKPPPDDLLTLIEATRADFAAVVDTGPLGRDPYRGILAGLSGTLAVFGLSVKRWERAVGDVIAARDPLPAEDRAALVGELAAATQQGAFEAMRKEAARMVRRLDRGLAVRLGLGVGGAYVLGGLSVVAILAVFQLGPFSREAESAAAWRDLVQNNPDPRPALAGADIRTDKSGRRYYGGVSLWLDSPRPPPGSTRP